MLSCLQTRMCNGCCVSAHYVSYDASRITYAHTLNSEDAHNLPGDHTGYHCKPGATFDGKNLRMLKWGNTQLKSKIDLDAEDLVVCSQQPSLSLSIESNQ